MLRISEEVVQKDEGAALQVYFVYPTGTAKDCPTGTAKDCPTGTAKARTKYRLEN